MRNLIARFNPAATDRLLFLAHWDTRPLADAPGSPDPTRPVPGANDGASGVAVLLAMADALKQAPPTIGVDLLFVDGEDFGSWDSRTAPTSWSGPATTRQTPLPGPKPRFAVLFDMVGDRDLQIYQEGNSLTAAPERGRAGLEGRGRDRLPGTSFPTSPGIRSPTTTSPCSRPGFLAIDLIDFDYPHWHTPDDTLDKVSAESLKAVAEVAMAVVRRNGR